MTAADSARKCFVLGFGGFIFIMIQAGYKMRYLLALIAVLAIIAAIVWGLDAWTQSSADLAFERGQAQALVIQAQGQSRLDSALAFSITSNAALPWLIVLCVSGFVTVAGLYLMRQPVQRYEPPRIIVQPVLMLPERQAEAWLMQIAEKSEVGRQ